MDAWTESDPNVDDDGGHHDANALQKIPDHVDESRPDAGVAMATKQHVGVAVIDGAPAVFVDLVVAAPVGVECGRVMEDVGHAVGGGGGGGQRELGSAHL